MDVRADRIPVGLPLHGYGRWFNNLPAGAHEALFDALIQVGDVKGERMTISAGMK
jgi:hypothetical protein